MFKDWMNVANSKEYLPLTQKRLVSEFYSLCQHDLTLVMELVGMPAFLNLMVYIHNLRDGKQLIHLKLCDEAAFQISIDSKFRLCYVCIL